MLDWCELTQGLLIVYLLQVWFELRGFFDSVVLRGSCVTFALGLL